MKHVKRVGWIDIVKFISIFFVIASHLGNHCIAPLLRLFYTPFFLSGFLFASGYVYRHRIGFGNHVKKKIFQLLIPWFCFSMLTRIVAQVRSFGMEKFLEDLKWNFLQIRGLDDGMWFIAALFVAYIPFYYLIDNYERWKSADNSSEDHERVRRKYMIFSLLLILVYYFYNQFVPASLFPWGKNALPWHIEYIPFALGCMFFGYATREKYESILDTLVSKPVYIVSWITAYLLMVYIPSIIGAEITSVAGCVYNCLLTCSGVLFVCCFAKIMPQNRFFLYVGQNTLVYFGMQGKVLFVLEAIFKKIDKGLFIKVTGDPLLSIIYSLLAGVVLIYILLIPAIIVNRYFPFMVGKKKIK